jgi:hypothetical protein
VAKRYRVRLTVEEREALGGMISRGKADARQLAHARVLLQAGASEGGPEWTDRRIAEAVRVICCGTCAAARRAGSSAQVLGRYSARSGTIRNSVRDWAVEPIRP